MKKRHWVGLLLAVAFHALIFVGIDIHLVPPSRGPAATTEVILISSEEAIASSTEALLQDPSVYFLPSPYSLRPSPGNYAEFVSPEAYFPPFEHDTSTSFERTSQLVPYLPPTPAIDVIAAAVPPFRMEFYGAHNPTRRSPTTPPAPQLVAQNLRLPPDTPPVVVPTTESDNGTNLRVLWQHSPLLPASPPLFLTGSTPSETALASLPLPTRFLTGRETEGYLEIRLWK